ncbi:uncharacterized protein F4807DRAFT_192238 [Annulohypoxylon truncatum]|uniref:uncharacterized protein n=1 Tax=Annulohypoxylon truncatum TaxID=327061 RepID=UPI00200726C7|nr:uncharacterized protein F4807DRAFT_192238 [Annulohypoxylon truncatum]KAI1207241.1 hypothetical protein F4807DRAFT_192238 [Annulohypoxylon truncatum]
MSTPFICRQCIARLTQSYIGHLRLKRSQLHTQALPSSLPQSQWASSPQRPESFVRRDVTNHSLPQPPTSHPGPFVSQIPGYKPGRILEPSRRRVETAKRAHLHRPTTLRRLKWKVLKSRGNYMFIRDDVAHLFGLTNYNARHAVNQLGRLIGGRPSGEEAGEELDRYHDWKRNLPGLLKAVKNSQSTPDNGEGLIQTNVEIDATEQSWETARGVWSELSNGRRQAIWRDYIASMFRSNPSQVPSFIQKTFRPEWCPCYIVEDSVYLLLRSLEGIRGGKERGKQVVDLVFFLLQSSPPHYLLLDQWAIWKAISLIPTSRLFEFYQAMRKLEHPLSKYTLLHFASRLAVKSKYKAQATDILRYLSTIPGFDINTPAASSVCTTLFTMKEGDVAADDHPAPDELFKALLDVGFRPSLLGLSALMRNFCLRGRVDVAWRVFNSLLEAGIEPDAHVFSILLNGAKKQLDGEYVQRDVDMIEATDGWTPVLLNDLLDYIYQLAESQGEKRRDQRKRLGVKAWRLMVQLYSKFFHRAPLQKLTGFPLEDLDRALDKIPPQHLLEVSQMVANLRQRPDDLLMQPDSITLEIMIKAHFRSIEEPAALQIYYKRFMSFFAWGDPVLTNLIKDRGNVVHDIFLRDLLQFKETFSEGVEMVRRRVRYAYAERKERGENIFHPPPSVHTYTILMNGFRNHKNYEGVVRTLGTMIEEGITPNIVTWNTVIGSLLETGSIRRAVRVIEHLNQIGLQPDDHTIEEVTRLSLAKRRAFADFMAKVEEKPRELNTRKFVKWLLRLWEKNSEKKKLKEPNISQKDARLINRFYQQVESENLRWNAGQREEEDKPQVGEKREGGGTDVDFITSVRRQAKENKASRRE